MKKFIAIILSVATLTACTKSEDKKKEKNNSPIFIAQNADYYKNGVVFGNEKALFLDFDTMEKAPLCAMPNCTHTTASCLSLMAGTSPVFYNDYVYFFSSNGGAIRETTEGPEFYIESKLFKASLDSSEVETVCEFIDCVPNSHFGQYVLRGNELYFTGDDMNPKEGNYGLIGFGNSGGCHFICSINLDTGEYTNYGSIYDGDKEYDGAEYSSGAQISGVYNDKMYLRYSFRKDNEALQNGLSGEEYWTFLNFEFDFENKTWTESSLPSATYMNEDTYVSFDIKNKLFNLIYKGEDIEIPFTLYDELFSPSCSEFNGKLFLESEGKWFDLNDYSEHSMEKYKDYKVIAYYDDCYIMIKGGLTVKITEDELLAADIADESVA